MKKLLFIFLIFPVTLFAELISIDLICGGEATTNCDQDNICDTQHTMERIKIDGNTLVHKTLGTHFLNVETDRVSLLELDDDGAVGFSFEINRKNGEINIVRGWNNPYKFNGVCKVGRPSIVEQQFN